MQLTRDSPFIRSHSVCRTMFGWIFRNVKRIDCQLELKKTRRQQQNVVEFIAPTEYLRASHQECVSNVVWTGLPTRSVLQFKSNIHKYQIPFDRPNCGEPNLKYLSMITNLNFTIFRTTKFGCMPKLFTVQ